MSLIELPFCDADVVVVTLVTVADFSTFDCSSLHHLCGALRWFRQRERESGRYEFDSWCASEYDYYLVSLARLPLLLSVKSESETEPLISTKLSLASP